MNHIIDLLKDELQRHDMLYTVDEDGDPLPLVDKLCPPDAEDVSKGQQEIEALADSIVGLLIDEGILKS